MLPGEYNVTLYKDIDGEVTKLSGPQKFVVEQMRKGALEGSSPEVTVAFWNDLEDLQAKINAMVVSLESSKKKVNAMIKAIERTSVKPGELNKKLNELNKELYDLETQLMGSKSKGELSEPDKPIIFERISAASIGTGFSTYGPTPTHKRSLEIAQKEFDLIKTKYELIANKKLPELENELITAGSPWIKGQELP